MAAVRDHGAPLVEDPARLAGLRAVGVDETAFLRANAHRHTQFVTGIVDIDSRRLLDVTEGRSEPFSPNGSPRRPQPGGPGSRWPRSTRSVATPPP